MANDQKDSTTGGRDGLGQIGSSNPRSGNDWRKENTDYLPCRSDIKLAQRDKKVLFNPVRVVGDSDLLRITAQDSRERKI